MTAAAALSKTEPGPRDRERIRLAAEWEIRKEAMRMLVKEQIAWLDNNWLLGRGEDAAEIALDGFESNFIYDLEGSLDWPHD